MGSLLSSMIHVGDHQKGTVLRRHRPVETCYKDFLAIAVRSGGGALKLNLTYISGFCSEDLDQQNNRARERTVGDPFPHFKFAKGTGR